MSESSGPPVPPRVIIVLGAQWPRALVRGALRELGYDAIGAVDLDGALRHPGVEPGRGPVGLIIVDESALQGPNGDTSADRLPEIRQRHPGAAMMLIASATAVVPPGPWARVLRRPLSVGAITDGVRALVPLPASGQRPLP